MSRGDERWRVFLGLPLPPEIRQPLEGALARARAGGLPAARWVRAENVHLTLAFLGSQPADEVTRAAEGAAAVVARHAPFELHLWQLGAFPSAQRASVLWLGLEAPDALGRIHRETQTVLEDLLEWEAEDRDFHPHLTLARCRRRWRRRDVERAAEYFEPLAGAGWQVEAATLWRSHLDPDGARYEVVSELPLAAPSLPSEETVR